MSVVRGLYKNREGKVTACYRKKYVIHVERITREKANGRSLVCSAVLCWTLMSVLAVLQVQPFKSVLTPRRSSLPNSS